MRIIYAVAGMMLFVFVFGVAADVATIQTEISDNAVLLAMAIAFAGGMAGGDK